MKRSLLIFLVILFANISFSQNNWASRTIRNMKDYVNIEKATFLDDHFGYTVYRSKIYKTTDGGINWALIPPPSSDTTSPVLYAEDANTIYVSVSNKLYNTSNSGNTWNLVHTFSDAIVTVFFQDALLGYANSFYQNFKTTDGGFSWEILQYPPGYTDQENYYVNENKIFSSNTLHFPLLSSNLIKSDNGGVDWSLSLHTGIYDNKILSLDFADISNGIVVSGIVDNVNGGNTLHALNLFITTDGGNSWDRKPIDVQNFKKAVISKELLIEIAGSDDFLYQFHNHASYFLKTFFNAKLTGIIKARAGNSRFLCGEYNALYKSQHEMQSYIDISSSSISHYDLTAISFADNLNGMVVGEKGTILKTTDGGENFFRISNQYGVRTDTANYNYVKYFNQNEAIVSSNNELKLTVNGGETWTYVNLPARETATLKVAFKDKDHGMVRQKFSGSFARVYYTSNGGQAWKIIAQDHNSSGPNYSGYSYSDFFFTANKIYLQEYYTWSVSVVTWGGSRTLKSSNYQNLVFSNEISIDLRANIRSFVQSIDDELIYYIFSWPNYIPSFIYTNGGGWVSDNPATMPSYACGAGNNIYYAINSGSDNPEANDYANNHYRVNKTPDRGHTWINSDSIISFRERQIYFVNNDLGFIIGNGGMILKTSNGGISTSTNIGSQTSNRSTLVQNYPNPFNPVTKINFSLPSSSRISVKIYDMLGKEVVVLINSELKAAGNYSVNFDGSKLSSGVYFYKLINEDNSRLSITKKMMLVK